MIKYSRTSILLVALLAASLINCNNKSGPEPPAPQFLTITLRSQTQYQTIEHFGASDAWSCQFVGSNWPDAKKNEIADYLFSRGSEPDGSPKGIGLTLWRFNIGAGSAQQGNSSGISDSWRRAEGFMRPDGSMDWNAQEGQRWFLKAAKNRGVEHFIGFANSPPVALTKNKKAFSAGGSSVNLSTSNFSEYAEFLIDAVEHIQSEDGVEIDYISPVNEPQWDWDNASQEGSPWRNSEIAKLVRQLNSVIQQRGSNIEIEIPEAAQVEFLYSTNNHQGRGDQIDGFFDPDSPDYLGDLDHVASHLAGHSYYSTWDPDHMIQTRTQLDLKMQQYSHLDYWMSEYTLLENNSEVQGPGRDLGIDPALYMARVMMIDLRVSNATSWQWWLGVSPYDYKDGLVYIDYDKNNGNVYTSKLLWALGNFSRFVKPGMIRVGTARSDNRSIGQTTNGVMEIAFISPDTNRSVTILVNYSEASVPVKIEHEGQPISCSIYRTSSANDLKKVGEHDFSEPIPIAPRSITTFVEK